MGHDHNHAHSLNASDINRSFIIGIILNVIYVFFELWYGWQQNSTALLSDAIHNIGDISSLLLAFVAFKLLGLKSPKNLTYGYKKVSIVASFINSILLVFAIGGIAWEGIQHILTPHKINGDVIMLVATIGIVVNLGSALLFRNKEKHDLNIKAAYWHLMADALVSAGVVISGLIIKFTEWYFLDGLVAVLVAVVILYSTWNIFKDSIIGILDGVPSSLNQEKILKYILSIDGVEDIHHVHIWSLSTNENAITCHIKINDFNNLIFIKNKIKEKLHQNSIMHSTIEFEGIEEKCNESN